MKDFVALARANPEKYNCATPPIGTTSQLQLELLKIRDKLPKLADVVFKGGGDAIAALLAGTAQLSSGSLPPALPHIKAGTLRCLAVTGDSRWPDLPDVPTMVEAGYKDFVFAVDCVLLAPAKTPAENVKWLETETLKVLARDGHERQAGQSRVSGAGQGRRCRVDAGDEGDRHVQADHRSGRRPEALSAVSLPKRIGLWAAIAAVTIGLQCGVGQVRAGSLRALAVTGAKRSSLFADLPTVAEAGLPGYAAELHYGLVAPAGTPADVIAKLNGALNHALTDDEIKNRLAADGTETLPGTPDAYAADIAGEEAKWGAIIKATGTTAQ